MVSTRKILPSWQGSIVIWFWISAALLAPQFANAIQAEVPGGNSAGWSITTEEMQTASDLLSTMGIKGLCHPSTNIYAPTFPKCSAASGAEPWRVGDRLLEEEQEEQDGDNKTKEELKELSYYILNGGLALLCVLCGALASGLTVGLLSLDPLLLVIKMKAGETELERRQAERLLPLVKKHHQLMVTLLLLNTMASESLPIFLQGMVPDSVAVFASVFLVLVFGEILPTALFTGKHQLKIATRLAPIVKIFMALMFPITYPIAKLLDHILHDDESGSNDESDDEQGVVAGTIFNRCELAALVRIQYDQRLAEKQRRKHQRVSSLAAIPDLDTSDLQTASDVRALKTGLLTHHTHHMTSDSIDGDEVMMIEGALQMKTKTAIDIYLSYHKVFSVPHYMALDDRNIFTIYASGYSRVPVFVDGDRQLVKGILMTRQLMVVKRQQQADELDPQYQTISDLNLHVPQCVAPHTNLIELVNLFQTGGSAVRAGHMALVCARPEVANEALENGQSVPVEAGLMGIITLEDVLEALLQEDILDEMDVAGRMPAAHDLEPIEEVGGYQLA